MTEIKDKILESPAWVGCLSFLLMLVLNFTCLDNPPYWDDILGLHNQAIWLANNNFNLSELWQPGQGFWEGGSNIYKFGIIAYLYGILYSLFSVNAVHIIGHLINLGCLALAFGACYSILRKFKINKHIALLWCAAVICEPVMSGRTAALGQESPLLCAAVLGIYFFADKKYWLGLVFVVAAILVKATGGILASAFVVWIVLDICLAKGNRKKHLKKYYLYLFAGIIMVICFLVLSLAETRDIEGERILLGKFFSSLKYQFSTLLPVQFFALCMVTAMAVWRLIVVLKNKTLFDLSEKDKISLLLLILTGGFWVSYGLYNCPLPRYSAFIVFPMYIFIALNTSSKNKCLTVVLAVILLLAGIININGRYYLRLQSNRLRSGEYLERSREYLNDLWENQKACKLLETKYFDRPVVAKWPFLQMLTVTEMGYVTKALPNVYAACQPIKYAKVKVYNPSTKMPNNTLYVFGFNSLAAWKEFGPSLFPERGKKYKIILKNQIKDGWFVIYEKEPNSINSSKSLNSK
jgi:hypothetical protein